MASNVLQELITEITRLKNKDSVPDVIQVYIYRQLSEAILFKLWQQEGNDVTSVKKMFELLSNELVHEQALKTLTLMEASDTWQQFEGLNAARKKREEDNEARNQPSDFDKLLKGFLAVPKPKETDLGKKGQQEQESTRE